MRHGFQDELRLGRPVAAGRSGRTRGKGSVLNRKTARALVLTIPQSILLRADRVIE